MDHNVNFENIKSESPITLMMIIEADLPLILILSVYTDFLPLEFGKIQIFFLDIWRNTEFFQG